MSETAQGWIVVICGLIVFIYGILRWVIWGKSRAQRFIEKTQKMVVKRQERWLRRNQFANQQIMNEV